MSEQANANAILGAKRPIRVCLLGSEGSGKTCFLAGMAVLREPNRNSPITVIPSDTVTVEYLDELARTLRSRQWPPPTNVTTILNMRVAVDGVAVELMMVDYPGEDFRNALAKLKSEEIDTLYDHYRQSEMIVLLFDPERDVRPISDPAHREHQIDRQLAHLQAIASIWTERSGATPARAIHAVDLAVAITKADQEQSLANGRDAKRFFRTYAMPLDCKLRAQSHKVKYFPLSAVGRSEQLDGKRQRVPASELSPAGYDELFGWILLRHRTRPFRRRARIVALIVIVLLVLMSAAFIVNSIRQGELRTTLNDGRLSRVERLEQTQPTSSRYWPRECESVRKRRAELFDEEIQHQRQRLDATSDIATLIEIERDLARLEGLQPGARRTAIEGLKGQVRETMETMLLQRVEDSFHGQSSDFPELAQEFLREYPTSHRRSIVVDWVQQWAARDRDNARATIRTIRVVNRASLGQKSERIVEFVTKHRDHLEKTGEAEPMLRAAGLAARFCEVNTYTVTLRRYGGFSRSRRQSLVFRVDGREVYEFLSPSASRIVTWSGPPLKVQWAAGQAIEVIWRNYTWRNADVSRIEDRGPTALRVLGGRQQFAPVLSNWESYVDDPFMHFEVDGISDEDWQALENYILPGDVW